MPPASRGRSAAIRATVLCALAVSATVFWLGSRVSAQEFKKHRVAILSPFASGVEGINPLDTAIQSFPFGKAVAFYTEHIDASLFEGSSHEDAVVQYLRSKYSSQRVDLVLAAGFASLNFALKHGAEIFGDVPFVFVSVEQSRLEGVRLRAGFTGITHHDDVRGTLEAALRLQPETREVVVVAGTSEYDQYWLGHDRRIFNEFESRVRFRYLTDLPMLALLRELNHLKPHTIVFLHALTRDGAGHDFSSPEAIDLITRNSNAPIYGFTAGEGFVGGRPTGQDDQRFPMALEIVRRILTGEKPAAIPIQRSQPKYPYVFNAKQLHRWNIDLSRVPPGSLLLRQEPSFWQLHRGLVPGVGSFVAVQTGLVTFLLVQRARRRKAEALLADRNERLQESERSLRELSGQLIGAQEEERKRIARELHDDLNQQVADLAISLSKIKRGIPQSMESAPGEILSVQNRLLSLSDGLRHLSHELHPGMLELFGLVPALKAHCDEFSAVTSIPVAFEADCHEAIAPDAALSVYRIAQEALRNVAKHSRATKATITVSRSANVLRLIIADDGIGFDEGRVNTGLGLRSMEERVWLVHGKLDVKSRPGAGTTVMVTIDFNAPQDAAAATA